MISEIGREYQIKTFQKGWIAALIGVVISGLLALHDGKGEGGTTIWPLFGITNQLIAGLSLLVITLYMKITNRRSVYVFIPMIFILSMTTIALVIKLTHYFSGPEANPLLFVAGALVFILELWLILEAILALRSIGKETKASISKETV